MGRPEKMKGLEKYFSSKEPVAVVYPCGYPVGFGLAKALLREGVKVIALDRSPGSVARYSRKMFHVCESGIVDSPGLIEYLKDFLPKFERKPVLFLVDDEDVLEAREHAESLSRSAHLTMAGDADRSLVDKSVQYRKFLETDIPMPRVSFVRKGEDVLAAADDVGYPCLLKPEVSTGLKQKTGRKLLKCDSPEDLEEAIDIVTEISDTFVVQEYIPGGCDKLYTFGSYVSSDGRDIRYFTGRKLRQFPPDFGTCRCGESLVDADLAVLGTNILRKLGYKGISQLEFKYDERDGQFKVIEINARSWLWMSLAVACGVNLPYAAYLDLTGERIPPYEQKSDRAVWVNAMEDLLNSVYGYKACGYDEYSISLFQWIRSLAGKRTYAFFSWDDPLPAIVRTWQFLRSYPGIIKKERNANVCA